MARRKYKVTSLFVCPDCGTEIPLPRLHCAQRKKGHIKDLYCPVCKDIKEFREYKYKEFYKNLDGEIIAR